MNDQRCKTCRFWQVIDEDTLGNCRRYPPTLIQTDHLNEVCKDALDELGTATLGIFPSTAAMEWCGEWQADVKSIATLESPIASLNLSYRAYSRLINNGFKNVRDVVAATEKSLMQIKKFGEVSLNEIKERLAELGLFLKQE